MRPGNPKVEDIDGLATLLKKAGMDFGVEDVADALWLAGKMGDLPTRSSSETQTTSQNTQTNIREEFIDADDTEEDTPQIQLSLPAQQSQKQAGTQPESGIPIKAPAAPALRIRLELARSLRPLRQTVPSLGRMEFDEAATVEQIADQQIWSPVLKPAPERWLEVALVVEDMQSLPLWEETIAEFQTLLERQGAFRRVTTWRLQTEPNQPLQLFPNWRDTTYRQRPRQAKHLWDPAKRRLILLLSDCTSVAWHQGAVLSWLEACGQQAPTAVIQLLPERLWSQTALGRGTPIWLTALSRGTVTANLTAQYRMALLQQMLAQPAQPLRVPVVSLEAEPIKQWAKVVAGSGESRAVGMQFDLAQGERREGGENLGGEESEPSPEERVQRFWTTASLMAQRLAGFMSAAPVSPPIVNLIRQTLLPKAEPVHVAEVYMGGLMQVQATASEASQGIPLQYDFADGVRNVLADAVSRSETESVLDAVSRYIADRLGLSTKNFEALLRLDFQGDPEAEGMMIPFAAIAAQTLERMGGEYAAIAQQLATTPKVAPPLPLPDPDDLFPLLQTYRFREAILSFESQQTESSEAEVAAEIERYGLTPREAGVWQLHRQDRSIRAIGELFNITDNTVRKHLNRIESKRQIVDSLGEGIRPEFFDFETASINFVQEQSADLDEILERLEEEARKRPKMRTLNELQEDILRGAWEGKTYEDMGLELHQSAAYIRKEATRLWTLLSQVLEASVTKRNLKSVLEKWAGAESRSELTLYRRQDRGWQFIETLPEGIELAMVSISGGTFTMGSPEDEEGRDDSEGPQHQVTLQPFFMGKYPITQAQWRAVASLPQVERELEADPSEFKSGNRPIEQIIWYDAVEFCARLSQHTGRNYRLPTEAEWEYACRAGTTTPFHFGETITSELANYRATSAYGDGPTGEYREQTTDVGSCPANAFGLYDMHGNVWEWCWDHWHDNYEGAPNEGSGWIFSGGREYDCILRGGSWLSLPGSCRSATRNGFAPVNWSYFTGFRVVCGVART